MLQNLQQAKNIYDIADLLGFQAKGLAYVLYSMPDAAKYTEFCVSKKNGKTRLISAPAPQLKLVQRRLSDILYQCRSEILLTAGKTRSFGFEKSVGTFENAACHRKKKWVFNSDIADFFPSFNFGRIRGFFLSNSDFSLDPSVATIIAQIACYANSLPQGAPSSPIIANLICGSLDYRLSRLAKRNRCLFSRYADDITFSTNERDFPNQIATPDNGTQGWIAGNVLVDILSQAGFNINHSKSRMSIKSGRQITTGLITNKIINTPIEDRKLCRSSVHRLLNDIPIEAKNFCQPFGNNCDKSPQKPVNPMTSLEAKIVNCFKVRDRTDRRDDTKKFYKPTSIGQSLRDFYTFKYFGRPGRPIILTEGPSDILYLKSALKASRISIPHLCTKGREVDADILCDFYNFPPLPGKIIGLSGGTGNIKIFLEFYHEFLKRLSNSVNSRPFIILLDSDSGIPKVLSAIKSNFGTEIKLESKAKFHSFAKNVALVKTPIPNGQKSSDVEDFLDKQFTNATINERTFTRNENYDRSKNFGKIELGKMLYNNRHNADHSRLMPLIKNISEAIEAL